MFTKKSNHIGVHCGHVIRPLFILLAAVTPFSQSLADVIEIEEVVVVAHPLAQGGLAQASTVLSGDELDEVKGASIGATLDRIPGVQSASFGTAVGRPVIHGLGGTRVKVTQDQIDTLDVSVASSDHAVTVEPFIAETISVLKGSSTLLYGSGAIGGVVDVDTGRHQTEVPEEFSGRAELRFADADDSDTVAARLDGRLTDSIAWHFDGFSRNADDYEIPGSVESSRLHAAEGHSDEDEEEEANGILTGSRNKSKGGAFSLSQVGERHHFSVAVSTIESNYGLLGGHEHEHEEDDHDDHDEDHDDHDEDFDELADVEGVGMIDMEQTRIDLRGGYQFDNSFIKKLDFLFADNDYKHSEIESSGEIGTIFNNQAWETRLELQHETLMGFDGLLGFQFDNRDFSALGEEAFIEPVSVESEALFWLGERQVGMGSVEAGLRVESVKVSPIVAQTFEERSFDTSSASLGYVIEAGSSASLGMLMDYSERAPSIEELYSNGAHLATQTYDIGDADLQAEAALSFSVTAQKDWDALSINATVYYSDFSDFIYQAGTGEELDEFPVFVYQQDNAQFYGLDLSADLSLGEVAGGELSLNGLLDFVNAEVDTPSGSTNLPRIPADRMGMGLRWTDNNWTMTVNYLHASTQNDVADFELPTDSYDDFSLGLTRIIAMADYEVQLFLNGKNLSDSEQRHHVSFVKDIAPAQGRSIEAGIRVSF